MGFMEQEQFVNWWTNNAERTARATATKCAEYGSQDLYGIGQNVARLAGREISRDAAFELGCLFYTLGKIERAMSAVQRGEQASDDTWFDLHVYANMVLAHRAGVWLEETTK